VGLGGTLVVIAFAATGAEAGGGDGPPWPLTKADIEAFATGGLRPVSIALVPSPTDPAANRWLAEFHRAADTEPDAL
jgi:hypothetical protein